MISHLFQRISETVKEKPVAGVKSAVNWNDTFGLNPEEVKQEIDNYEE